MFALFKQSDARAVRQVLSGRRDQFATLVERYLPAVYAVSYAQLRNHADAEDVAQEAFLAAFTSLHTLREPHKFEGWVVSMARRIAVHLRQKRQLESDVNGIKTGEAVVVPDVAREELRQLLRQEIDRLEEDDREVLLLHYFTGKSTGEVAVVLDIGREAAKKRLQRARQQLSDNLLRQVEDETKPRKSFETQKNTIAGLVLAVIVPWDVSAAGTGFSLLSAGTTKLIAIVGLTALLITGGTLLVVSGGVSGNEQVAVKPAPTLPRSAQLEEELTVPTPTAISEPQPLESASDEAADASETLPTASLNGLWRICDDAGSLPGINLMVIVQQGNEFTIHVAEHGKAGVEIASGTIGGGDIQLNIVEGENVTTLTGATSDFEHFDLSGVHTEYDLPLNITATFTRLNERDLAEVDIQERRIEEVNRLVQAVQAYAKNNGNTTPASLADLVPEYLPGRQLVDSAPSRVIAYIPDSTARLVEIKAYANARTHQERLLKQEADRLAAWPDFPSMPPLIAVEYAAPAMTLASYSLEQSSARRIDDNGPMACPPIARQSASMSAAQSESCKNNMTQLGIVAKMFVEKDKEKRFPGGFSTTVPDFMANTLILTCPSLGEEGGPGRTVSYSLLFPGFTREELLGIAVELGIEGAAGDRTDATLYSKIPLVIEENECSKTGGSHVAFVDGHVELLQPKEWDARIAPFVEYSERYYADL